MNIPEDILSYAERIGLSSISTGGNCDFVAFIETDTTAPHYVLYDENECPDGLSKSGEVVLQGCIDNEFYHQVCARFNTAKDAMDAMTTQPFRLALFLILVKEADNDAGGGFSQMLLDEGSYFETREQLQANNIDHTIEELLDTVPGIIR